MHNTNIKKGIFFGVLVGWVIAHYAGVLTTLSFALFMGYDVLNEYVVLSLSENLSILFVDLFTYLLMFVFAGWISAKYAYSQKVKLALITGIVTLVIYVLLFAYVAYSDTESYPFWFIATILCSIVPLYCLGALLRKQPNKQIMTGTRKLRAPHI